MKAGGKEGELLIVIEQKYWDSQVGDTLRGFFEGEFPGLPQQEYLFKVYRIFPQNFVRNFKSTNNILMININEKYIGKTAELEIGIDTWANSQIVLRLNVGNEVEFFKAFENNKRRIFELIRGKDCERIQQRYKEMQAATIANDIKEKFNISVTIPEGYFGNLSDTNFYYAMHEATKKVDGFDQQITRGLWIHSFPITDPNFFNVDYLSKLRNQVTEKYIKGRSDSTFQLIEDLYEIDSTGVSWEIKQPDGTSVYEYCMEMRGLWKMNNVFMGGPFINYTYFDKKNKRIIMIDGYVFAPGWDKREYMIQMEAMARSLVVH